MGEVDTSVDLDERALEADESIMARRRRVRSMALGMNFCPPKPGLTLHDQHHVELVEDVGEEARPGGGVDGHGSFHAGLLDLL